MAEAGTSNCDDARVAYRNSNNPSTKDDDLGFRLVRVTQFNEVVIEEEPEHEALVPVLALLQADKKVRAIKEVRALAGLGLKSAKAAVESYQATGRWPQEVLDSIERQEKMQRQKPALDVAADSIAELETAARFIIEGSKIKGIKRCATEQVWGLKTPKLKWEYFEKHKRWSDNVSKVLKILKLEAAAGSHCRA